jgi:N-glycosylase/DNA lyase
MTTGFAMSAVVGNFEWTQWRVIEASPKFSEKALAETLDGGQMFRFTRGENGVWQGIWDEYASRICLDACGNLEASFPVGMEEKAMYGLRHLLALDMPYAEYYSALPRNIDSVIDRAMKSCEGLRIVNLPIGEALLSFLCSPMKRIPQIKEVLENLAHNFGDEFLPGFRSLPTWEKLATIDETDLRKCRLGFRAHYIAVTARMLAERPSFLDDAAKLPYPLARKKLQELQGVGGKIADCVLLFSGMSGLQPFPVDTWILQAMARLYGLEDRRPEEVAVFGREHFGPLAGLAQQFLFVYARDGKLKQ